MVPFLERLRASRVKSDAERIAAKLQRETVVNNRLDEITKDLTTDESIMFSTIYRFHKKVPTIDDFNLTDNFGDDMRESLNSLLNAITRENGELTPDLLWTVPGIDPSKNKRAPVEFPSEQAEVVVVDFKKAETKSIVPEAA